MSEKRRIDCTNNNCKHSSVIDAPAHQPHCPKCGFPVKLSIVKVAPAPVTAGSTGNKQTGDSPAG